MTLAHIGLFVLGLFIGATVGVLCMGALNASGPNVDEAISMLGCLYALIVTKAPISDRVLQTVSRYLQRYGDGQ